MWGVVAPLLEGGPTSPPVNQFYQTWCFTTVLQGKCTPLERQAQKGPPERKTPRYGGGVREPKTAPKSVKQKGGVSRSNPQFEPETPPFWVHTFRGFRLYASVGRAQPHMHFRQ